MLPVDCGVGDVAPGWYLTQYRCMYNVQTIKMCMQSVVQGHIIKLEEHTILSASMLCIMLLCMHGCKITVFKIVKIQGSYMHDDYTTEHCQVCCHNIQDILLPNIITHFRSALQSRAVLLQWLLPYWRKL